jgi:hypothetical protein
MDSLEAVRGTSGAAPSNNGVYLGGNCSIGTINITNQTGNFISGYDTAQPTVLKTSSFIGLNTLTNNGGTNPTMALTSPQGNLYALDAVNGWWYVYNGSSTTGVSYSQGATGIQGVTGVGVAGATGAGGTGSQGVTGVQGETGAGIQGATGVGSAGSQGVTGIQGVTGTATGGVASIAKSGSTALTGAVTLSSDASLALTQVSQNIQVGASSEFAGGNTVASQTVNFSNGVAQDWTLNVATTTFTFSNGINGTTHVLRLIQSGSGNNLVSWPAGGSAGGVKWPGGVAPTLSTSANAIDVVVLYYDGTYYYGTYSLSFQ